MMQLLPAVWPSPIATYFSLSRNQNLGRAKQVDTSRSRRNFAKHVTLLRRLPRYFATMNTISPGRAHVLDASAPATTVAETAISIIRSGQHAKDSLTILQHLADWLRTTAPEPKELSQLDTFGGVIG